jgi:hypothetical protein
MDENLSLPEYLNSLLGELSLLAPGLSTRSVEYYDDGEQERTVLLVVTFRANGRIHHFSSTAEDKVAAADELKEKVRAFLRLND